MLVDDEKVLLDLIGEMLKNYGYETVAFFNSIQAMDAFRQHPDRYDLVIADMTMPYMTGSQLAKNFLEIRPEIPIILCTGYSDLITREKSLAMGIKEYLEKPLKMSKLLHTVKTVLDQVKN